MGGHLSFISDEIKHGKDTDNWNSILPQGLWIKLLKDLYRVPVSSGVQARAPGPDQRLMRADTGRVQEMLLTAYKLVQGKTHTVQVTSRLKLGNKMKYDSYRNIEAVIQHYWIL